MAKAGREGKVQAVLGDMFHLPFPETTFDVIWSEGAVYILGFQQGLRDWRKLLRRGGYVAVSELTWLRSDPPAEVASFFRREYPAMQDVEDNLRSAAEAGYAPLEHFVLPESAWWTDYYTPLEKKLAGFRANYAGDQEVMQVVSMEQAEIDLYRRYSNCYGYVFYLLRSLEP
jgi:SAM-dependent methyltransferase